MFKSDAPIKSANSDLLGRAKFSKALGEALLHYENSESLVVGLFGEWGTGKTSVINMALEHLQLKAEKEDQEAAPLVVRFNPWNFSDQNQLITQFFNVMSSHLQRADKAGKLRAIAEKLKGYAATFKPLKLVPSIGGAAAQVLDAAEEISDGLSSVADATDQDLSQTRAELNALLASQKRKIIILIDDIDRLTSTEMRQIFQLVKSLGDFPYTIYVLSMDKNVVAESLKEVQGGDGINYLEKIVQIPFEIPKCVKADLDKYFFSLLDIIFADVPQEEWDGELWSAYVLYALYPMIRTLRDANRLANHLAFSFPLVKGEVCAPDFIALAAIQLFAPDVYSCIRDNKDLFVGVMMDHESKDEKLVKHSKQFYDNMFSNGRALDREQWERFLIELFPRLSRFYGSGSYSSDFISEWRKERRLCTDEYFNRYFQLSLDRNELSRVEFEKLLSSTDTEFFIKKLNQYIDEDKISSLMRQLWDAKPELMSAEFIVAFLRALSLVMVRISDQPGMFIFSHRQGAQRLFRNLALKLDRNRRLALYEELFSNSNYSLNQLVLEAYLSGSEHGLSEEKKYQLPEEKATFTLDGHMKLQAIGLKRVRESAASGKLLREEGVLNILYRWKEWSGNEEIQEWVSKQLAESGSDIELIRALSTTARSSRNERIVLSDSTIVAFVAKIEDLENAVERIAKRDFHNEYGPWLEAARNAIRRYRETLDS